MTAVLMVLEIIMGVMFLHPPVGVMTRDREVEGGAFFDLVFRTLQSRAAFGHMSGFPEASWNIFSPLTPLFWVVKLSVTNFVALRLASVEVAANTLRPQMNATFLRQKGVLSELDSL